jgi:hypothetical protein
VSVQLWKLPWVAVPAMDVVNDQVVYDQDQWPVVGRAKQGCQPYLLDAPSGP